jgi:hypothetical protein
MNNIDTYSQVIETLNRVANAIDGSVEDQGGMFTRVCGKLNAESPTVQWSGDIEICIFYDVTFGDNRKQPQRVLDFQIEIIFPVLMFPIPTGVNVFEINKDVKNQFSNQLLDELQKLMDYKSDNLSVVGQDNFVTAFGRIYGTWSYNKVLLADGDPYISQDMVNTIDIISSYIQSFINEYLG